MAENDILSGVYVMKEWDHIPPLQSHGQTMLIVVINVIVIRFLADIFLGKFNSQEKYQAGDWLIEHGFTSAPTQYRLYGRRFLQLWWPNQQCGDDNMCS